MGRQSKAAVMWFAAADELTQLATIGTTLPSALLCVQLLLAIRYSRQLAAFSAFLDGDLPRQGLQLPPAQLALRLRYLARRFAPHAPTWELVIWAWQATLLVVSEILNSLLPAIAHDQSVTAVAQLIAIIVVECIILAGWYAHHKRCPYARTMQNRLASGLYGVSVWCLALVFLYTILEQSSSIPFSDAPTEMSLVIEWLLFSLVIGGIAVALVVVVIDARRMAHTLASVDAASALLLTLADEELIDRRLRQRLRDGDIRLLRCSWLRAGCESTLRDEKTGAIVMKRQQDLMCVAQSLKVSRSRLIAPS